MHTSLFTSNTDEWAPPQDLFTRPTEPLRKLSLQEKMDGKLVVCLRASTGSFPENVIRSPYSWVIPGVYCFSSHGSPGLFSSEKHR